MNGNESIKGTRVSWYSSDEDGNGYWERKYCSDDRNDEECCSRPKPRKSLRCKCIVQMYEKEELKKELEQELQWVKYRQKMLDIMEAKLLQMNLLAEQAKEGNLISEELEVLNDRLIILATQVRVLEGESRKMENNRRGISGWNTSCWCSLCCRRLLTN